VRRVAGGTVALGDRGGFVQHLIFLPQRKTPPGKPGGAI
jgi:hypothetical protein